MTTDEPWISFLPESSRASVSFARPNDQDLYLYVRHIPNATVRCVTDDSAFPGEPIKQGHSRITLPRHAISHRIGRMDLEVQVNSDSKHVKIDLLAPTAQAARVEELVNELVRTPWALLAIPRSHHRLDPEEGDERDRVENLVEASRLFSEAAQLLAASPPTRSSQVETEAHRGVLLTAGVVQALTSQLYALQPTTPGPHTLPLRGRHYEPSGLIAPQATEVTDSAPNRFVHGVGLTLERVAHEVRDELALEHSVLTEASSPIDGYVTIKQLTRVEAISALAERLQRLDGVIHEVRLARSRLIRRLPVRYPTTVGGASPKVLLDPRYARVRRTLNLLRAPARGHYGIKGAVAGISSLSTLYELYCLSALHDELCSLGYHLKESRHDPTSGPSNAPHTLHDGSPFSNVFTYWHCHQGQLDVLYEPRITRQPHASAGLLTVSAFSANYTPDIVLNGEGRILILDAKFVKQPPRNEMPSAAMKYLHGLHPATPNSQVIGLHLLHYSSESTPVEYHDRPITPAISTVPVHPRNKGGLAQIMRKHYGPG